MILKLMNGTGPLRIVPVKFSLSRKTRWYHLKHDDEAFPRAAGPMDFIIRIAQSQLKGRANG